MNRSHIVKAAVLGVVLLLAWAAPSQAELKIFACEPEWAALAQELGGDLVSTYSATTGLQDPHQVQARPSLIARTRNADLLFCTGATLEIGWLPMLQMQGANGAIQIGATGYMEAAASVPLKEVPIRVDRAQGDVHPAGNPHIQTDPRNIAKIAQDLTDRLVLLDPRNADTYRKRSEDFLKRWNAAIAKWEGEAAPLKGLPVVVYHKGWVYMLDWLGMREVGTLEPKPSVPPSAAHLNDLIARLKADPAKMVIRAAYNDDRAARFVSEREHIPEVVLPFTIGGTEQAKDLFSLYDETVNRLLGALK
jgi:zinc/manganese transport system substrate-binding protein